MPSKPYLYWIVIFILLAYAIPVTFMAVFSYQQKPIATIEPPAPNSLLKNQTAVFEGQIDSIEGNTLLVTSKDKVKGKLELSDSLIITDSDNPMATPSADLAKIQTGRDVTIHLSLVDGVYKVTNMNFQLIPVFIRPDQMPKISEQKDPKIGASGTPTPPVLTSPPAQPSSFPVASFVPLASAPLASFTPISQ